MPLAREKAILIIKDKLSTYEKVHIKYIVYQLINNPPFMREVGALKLVTELANPDNPYAEYRLGEDGFISRNKEKVSPDNVH